MICPSELLPCWHTPICMLRDSHGPSHDAEVVHTDTATPCPCCEETFAPGDGAGMFAALPLQVNFE